MPGIGTNGYWWVVLAVAALAVIVRLVQMYRRR
jgi:hypothetical protein